MEREYRRGFCEGWERALEALFLLIEGEGLTFEAGYNVAGEFLDDMLQAWQRTNPFREIAPPSLAGE